MQKAIAYYRVSSKAQEKKESIEVQKHQVPIYATEKGYDLIDEYWDDGIRGESIAERPAFQKVLDVLAEGNIDVFLVYMIDRIGRFADRSDRNRVIELLISSKTNVDSPFCENVFRHDSEKNLNDLEAELNESRLKNVLHGIRVRGGHLRNRMRGRLAGGHPPYGIHRTENGGFEIGEKEYETLTTIFSKLRTGWGLQRTADYLNTNLDKYPKKKRKSPKGSYTVTEWSAAHLRTIVLNDFYFTGIVEPTKASKKKGVLAVDTKLKDLLFDKKMIEVVRREMKIRRSRKSSQKDKTIFMDVLFSGYLRCKRCGWKLGLATIRIKDKKIYRYYVCRGCEKNKRPFKLMDTQRLDKIIWSRFIETLEDPAEMKKMILAEGFLVDKDRETKKALLAKAEVDLKNFLETKNRYKKMYGWGHLDEKEFLQEIKGIERLLRQAEESIEKFRAILARPKEVKDNVEQSTKIVSEETEKIRALDKTRKLLAEGRGIPFGATRSAKLKAINKKLKIYEQWADIYEDLEDRQEVDFDNLDESIQKLIFKMRRSILQKYIDFDSGGIQVGGFHDIDIFFSIEPLRCSW